MSNTPKETGLSEIGQIAVNIHHIDAAVAFYRDVLGMKFLFQIPKMAFFDCGGIRLMLSEPEKPEFDHPSSIIYFKVGDIQATWKTLTDRGVSFETTPHLVAPMPQSDLWMAFFRDCEGNLMALMSEVPRQTS